MCLQVTDPFGPERTVAYKVVESSGGEYCSYYKCASIKLGADLVSDREAPEIAAEELERGIDHGIHVFTSLDDAKRFKGCSWFSSEVDILECEVDPRDWVADGMFEAISGTYDSAVYMKVKPIQILQPT